MERERFRQILDDYFTFTRSERRGLLLWSALLLVAVLLRMVAGYIHPGEPADPSLFAGWPEAAGNEIVRESAPEKRMFIFNPNTISEVGLDSLDMPGKVINNLKRYRQKGGVFRKEEDLRKLYGMTDSLFNRLVPFIRMETSPPSLTRERSSQHQYREDESSPVQRTEALAGNAYTRAEVSVVELNAADSAELVKLPGIGPVFAGRIVRYRELLGGFFSLDQLGEVYGMTRESIDGLDGRVRVDTSQVRPVRINFAGYGQLSRHPYIRGKLAGRIIDWRSANGPYSNNSILLKTGIVDTVHYKKLNYYLTCQ